MERALFVFVNGLLPKTFLVTKSIADSVRKGYDFSFVVHRHLFDLHRMIHQDNAD